MPPRTTPDQPLEVVRLPEFLASEFPGRSWLVRDLVPGHGLTFLAGFPKSFKSLLASQLCLSVATSDVRFLSRETQHGAVVLVEAEGGRTGLQDRLRTQSAALGQSPDRLFVVASQQVRIDTGLQGLEELCRPLEPVLISLDPFAFLHQMRENQTEDMARLMVKLVGMATRLECALLIVHHEPKPNGVQRMPVGLRIRGSSVFAGATEANLLVRRSGSSLYLDGELREADSLKMTLRLDPETLTLSVDKDADRSPGPRARRPTIEELRAFVEDGGSVSVADVEKHFDISKNTARSRLKEAVDADLLDLRIGPRSRELYTARR